MAKHTLSFKVINVEKDPVHANRHIVSLQFDDGNKELGPWIQAFSLLDKNYPITMDEFVASLVDREIGRPKDAFFYIKEAKELGKTYTLNLTDNTVPGADNAV